MSSGFHIVVCGTLAPDPLQTLEPISTPTGPGLKNEMMLPSVLDPWAAHSLYEASHLSKNVPDCKVWLVSLGPKGKLQQLMMTVAQKAAFEFVAVDAPSNGFVDSFETAQALTKAIEGIQGLDKSKLLLFGGMSSAFRDSGAVMPMVGELLGITDIFVGVDELSIENGGFKIKERVEGAKYQISTCTAPPAVIAWATGNLPEPPNNPQLGMTNMRTIMPALQKAQPAQLNTSEITYHAVEVPQQRRDTRVEKDMPIDAIAAEIVAWLKG